MSYFTIEFYIIDQDCCTSCFFPWDICCPSSLCSSYGIPRPCLQGNSLAWPHYDS